jgi:DNA replication protein DnaC
VLVLDDLGSSKPSTWALETVGHILNTRYNEKRVTLLTTNFLDTDIAAAHSRELEKWATARQSNSPLAQPLSRTAGMRNSMVEDSLTDRVGRRIRSRLYEMCRTIEMFAPDYRKEVRNVSRFRA